MERHVRKDRAHGVRRHPLAIAQVGHPPFIDVAVVALDDRMALELVAVLRFAICRQPADGAVAMGGECDADAVLGEIPAPLAAAGADAHQVDRTMADIVMAVADEILRGELPVAGYAPLLHAADHLRAAGAAVA